MLELLAGGGAIDSFVDLIDGQISQIKTTDTSTGRSVSLNIINNDGDMDAERFFIEAEDASLELTGRLPRDIQDIKQLFDLASISEGEPGYETSLLSYLKDNHFEVEGLSLSSPNNKLISIDNTGLRFTLPYEVLDDTLVADSHRAIQLEVLGTVHQLEPLSAELDGISISDVILDSDGSLISIEDSLAISMTTDKWTLNFREFELALEGTLENELTQIQEYLENELVNARNIGVERASISVGEVIHARF